MTTRFKALHVPQSAPTRHTPTRTRIIGKLEDNGLYATPVKQPDPTVRRVSRKRY